MVVWDNHNLLIYIFLICTYNIHTSLNYTIIFYKLNTNILYITDELMMI